MIVLKNKKIKVNGGARGGGGGVREIYRASETGRSGGGPSAGHSPSPGV